MADLGAIFAKDGLFGQEYSEDRTVTVKNRYKITVFTPTYNRANILTNLYQSLRRQSFSDFEWLIVDDGSTDNTKELVDSWIRECGSFPIRYYKKANGGKCRAINFALNLAEGTLFFTVDSDDYLTDDALEKVDRWESEIPHDGTYCGVAGNIGLQADSTENSLFDGGFYDGTLLDRYRNVDGERALIFYTDIHRNYKYPEFEGESFMTEAVTWNRMARDGYRMRFYNDIIWIYAYMEDGLTLAGKRLFIENPRGYALWLRERLAFENAGWIRILRFYYSMTAELSDVYDNRTIAECLQIPEIWVRLCRSVLGLRKQKVRK